jgi:hypothetical protein
MRILGAIGTVDIQLSFNSLPIVPKIRMSDLRVDFKVRLNQFLMIFLLVLLISSVYVALFRVRKPVNYWIVGISLIVGHTSPMLPGNLYYYH